jgi:hypothetical protein
MSLKIIFKIETLIADINPFLLKAQLAEKSITARQELRLGEYSAYTSSVQHFLKLILDIESPYINDYKKNALSYNSKCIQNGVDILKRILQDVKDGWLIDLKGIISAEIFTDFLEMAKHLLSEHYKDPAAVIIGTVLEEHLKNICIKNKISTISIDSKAKPINKKASILNDELAKTGVYNILEQKSVTAWLDLRNKAAHGKYTEYDISQVNNMLQNVIDFIVRNPV